MNGNGNPPKNNSVSVRLITHSLVNSIALTSSIFTEINYDWGDYQDVSPPKLLASGAQRIVLYDFQLSRSGQCPKAFLKNYQGYLQVDGYSGYEQISAQLVGCWAHARHYFMEFAKTSPKGKAGKHTLALYHIQNCMRLKTEHSSVRQLKKRLPIVRPMHRKR